MTRYKFFVLPIRHRYKSNLSIPVLIPIQFGSNFSGTDTGTGTGTIFRININKTTAHLMYRLPPPFLLLGFEMSSNESRWTLWYMDS